MIEEPRFLLDKDSICFGCTYFKHYTESDDANYWLENEGYIDDNGGVCDIDKPCICGNMNSYDMRD